MRVDLFGDSPRSLAIARLQEFEPKDRPYWLAFSGGKDSQCIYHLAIEAGVKFEAVYNVSPDPPELLKFMRKNYPDVRWQRCGTHLFKEMPKHRFPPTRIARWCCELHKESSAPPGSRVVLGIRHAESARRSKRKMVENCYRVPGTSYISPIIDWAEGDVWAYLKSINVESCELYKTQSRIGCVGCPMGGKNRYDDFEKWPRYKKAWQNAVKKTFDRSMADGHAEKKNWTWQTWEEMWARWMEETTSPDDDNQCFKFDD